MNTITLRRLVILTLITGLAGVLQAQSNERIDELLGQDPAEVGHTAYLILSASGLVSEDTPPEQALRQAAEAGLVSGRTSAEDAIDFGTFSYMLMESFDIPGGVMYRVFPGRRYASREVNYQGWSRDRLAPGTELDGETVVRILSIYLNQGGAQ